MPDQLEAFDAVSDLDDSSRSNPRSDGWRQDVELSRSETDALRRWSADPDGDPYDLHFGAYDRTLRERLSDLPRRFVEAVKGFGGPGSSVGVLRLRGIPVPDDLPPTPSVPYATIRERVGTEPIMLALGMLVGQALSLPHFRNGERIHNIYPMPQDVNTQKASNSTRLELHSEMAFVEGAPDALAILCLRASESPPTTGFCDMRSLWDTLGEQEQLLLQETEFSFRYTGPDKGREFFDLRCPLARREPGGLRFQYDFGAGGVTPRHDAALMAFRERMAGSVSELTLAAGDLALIDNRRMVHGRSPMSPSFTGCDRWLQRCLLRLNPPAGTA